MTNKIIYTAEEWGNKFSLSPCKKHPSQRVNSYHNTAKLIETLEGMRGKALPPEHHRCDEVMFYNRSIDEMIEHLKGNRDDKN